MKKKNILIFGISLIILLSACSSFENEFFLSTETVQATCNATPTIENCINGEPIRLTHNNYYNGKVSWSPASSLLAFTGSSNITDQISVMNFETSEVVQITNNIDYLETDNPITSFDYSCLSWSPDGNKLLISVDYHGTDEYIFGLFILDVTRSIETPFVQPDDSDFEPIVVGHMGDWSPDGKQILFTNFSDSKNRQSESLYIYNLVNQESTRITPKELLVGRGRWSPDGSKIAFTAYPDNDDAELFVINSDGTNLAQLTNNLASEVLPVWSPDGKYIAFTTNQNGNWDIYALSLESNILYQITQNPLQEIGAAWSADNTIAFSANWESIETQELFNMGFWATADFEIYIIKVCLP